MDNFVPGMMARSQAGHDKGSLYFIVRTEGEYVYLTDGVRRTLAKPKKKKYRHIQIIKQVPEDWNPDRISDDNVKRMLKEYEKKSANLNLIKVEEKDV